MKMKWIVELDYDICGFEPNAIYFRRVYSNEIEYSSAYDTKREALEAFCVGQVAMGELRKEREAEQKKGEETFCDKDFTSCKDCCIENICKERPAKKEAFEKQAEQKPVFYSKTFPPTIEERIEALESVVEKLRSHKDCAISSLKALEKKIEEFEKKVGNS